MANSKQRGIQRLNRRIAQYIEQAIRPTPPIETGYYLGYDADTGDHSVRLPNGKTVVGRMITNGEPKLNSLVSVKLSPDGNLFDSMPR